MAIAFDTSVNAGVTASTSITWPHTITGLNTILWVGVFGDTVSGDPTGTNIAGATYGGISMNLLTKVGITGDRWVYLFYLLVSAQANNVIVSSSGVSIVIAGQSASYAGVQQSGVPDASATNSTNAGGPVTTGITTSLNTVLNNCWTILFTKNDIGAPAADTGSTQRQASTDGAGIFDSNATISPAGSTSMTVNSGGISARWGTIMASFAPFEDVATDTIQIIDLSPTIIQSRDVLLLL